MDKYTYGFIQFMKGTVIGALTMYAILSYHG